jgi:hypothetical protein
MPASSQPASKPSCQPSTAGDRMSRSQPCLVIRRYARASRPCPGSTSATPPRRRPSRGSRTWPALR